jgi:quercetin dioxygenase-like cupin family protein
MVTKIPFGESAWAPAPERWGCTNLDAAQVLSDPSVVVHHYRPGGEMREHTGHDAALCVCVDGSGFVKVGNDEAELSAHQAVVWPKGQTHKVWTTHSSMTVLLIHFPERSDLKS